MTTFLIDGKAIAQTLRNAITAKVGALNIQPCLAVILVGDDPASAIYVRNKDRAAHQVGISVRTVKLDKSTTQVELLKLVKQLNDDTNVDGILVQMALPSHINSMSVIDAIDPSKDVDGLHPMNAGLLAAGRQGLTPCTPRGVMKLLDHIGTPLDGARAIVLGRSVLVGRPMAALLTAANATVTLAHSRTRNLASECRRADIVVAAVGRAEIVSGDWVKPGAVVIDVGINRSADGKLTGDVDFAACAKVASAITPVPGGVGPMTIACLLENTVIAALKRRGMQLD